MAHGRQACCKDSIALAFACMQASSSYRYIFTAFAGLYVFICCQKCQTFTL